MINQKIFDPRFKEIEILLHKLLSANTLDAAGYAKRIAELANNIKEDRIISCAASNRITLTLPAASSHGYTYKTVKELEYYI